MCLIIIESRVDNELPLVVGANRDERFDRPAISMTVMRPEGPRILGGRDLLAGGTWLAVNEHGLVAGLTNRPTENGRDPSKRSRGELPLMLARHITAEDAVDEFVNTVRPNDFNLAWLLVADRNSLYYLTLADSDIVGAQTLGPGVHVLGNGPLSEPSPKTDSIYALLSRSDHASHTSPVERLSSVLSDHSVPAAVQGATPGDRPPQLFSACVHTEGYGTRSSTVVTVPPRGTPNVWTADGPPCQARYVCNNQLWDI